MTLPGTLAAPVAERGSRTGGVRLSGLTVRVYRGDRDNRDYSWDEPTSLALLRANGRPEDMAIMRQWRGHAYTAMTADLLDGLARPLPELDLVVLAYQTPDLHVGEAAGCYLAQRCPGDPASFAISQQGPGAAFTALRVADSMHAFGALRAGAVFVLDQTTPLCEPGTDWRAQLDATVLVEVGTDGPVLLHRTWEAEGDPVELLANAIGQQDVGRIVVGATLGARLDRRTQADPRLLIGPGEHGCTSAFVALEKLWPVTEPVLLADYDPDAGRLHAGWLGPVESR
ncbi:MAG TPA: hypothetical protein VGM75_33890 [Pseudonocardiaceae bacterium]|jgi:hypothetical protein